MILLDTDHVTVLKYPAAERCLRLVERLEAVPASEPIGVSVITVEEQMRGWLAAIAKERAVRRQVAAYRELAGL
jgi:tRNA(fMet)-specific endonuclease VapC